MGKAVADIENSVFLDDIFYYKEHTWVKTEGNFIKVGITDFAQNQLGEIIFIELPRVGDEIVTGDVFGQAESAKVVSSLYMPVSGRIVSINNELENSPEIVNANPYGDGWMITVEPKDLVELDNLLNKDGYIDMLNG